MDVDDGGDQPQHVPDCCEDDATMSRTGQACKPGQNCQASQFSIPLSIPVADAQSLAPAPRQAPAPPWSPLALNAIWRPPLHLPR